MTNLEDTREKYGQRIQRCYGCFVAFYLRDMWLGDDATYYCENCKDESMFHFDEFTQMLDISRLPSMQQDDEHH
jgi:predicted RNA-binding protein with PUA-like domain